MRVFLILAGLVSASACAPQVVVVRQAVPNPFLHQSNRSFFVEPIRASGGAPLDTDVVFMTHVFTDRLSNDLPSVTILSSKPPGPSTFLLRSMLERWQPRDFSSRWAEAELTVQIVSPAGPVLDELRIRASESALAVNDLPPQLEACARQLADRLARYLRSRTQTSR